MAKGSKATLMPMTLNDVPPPAPTSREMPVAPVLPQRAPGVSRQFIQAPPPAEPQPVFTITNSARILYPDAEPPTETVEEAEESEAAPDGQPVQPVMHNPEAGPHLPEWLASFCVDEQKALAKFKTPEDLAKSYLNVEKQFGRVSGEKAGLERQINDLVDKAVVKSAETGKPVKMEDIKKKAREIGKKWLDSMDGENAEQLVEVAVQAALTDAQGAIDRKFQEIELGHIEMISQGYPGLLAGGDDWKAIDELASHSEAKTTLGKYKSAFSQYAKQKGYVSGQAGGSVSTTEEPPKTMPVTRTATSKGKVYNRAWLQQLMTTNPAEYRRLQPEITKAYAEGRVR